MKKVLLILLAILVILLLVLFYNYAQFKSTQIEVAPIEVAAIPDGAVDRFAKAISIKTISYADDADFDSTQFQLFNEFLENEYPNINATCTHQIFSGYSHLYEWKGKDESLDPIVFMAHLDVVPIASLALWTVNPFDEGVKDGVVYGRGAMDDKCSLISIAEAVEQLIAQGFQPSRTIYLSFGHDEEIGGQRGAIPIAKHLVDNGIKASFVLDEGMARIKDYVPGVDGEVGLIGIAEKGYMSLEFEVNMEGGHSSSPSAETSIDVLAGAISKLKKTPFEPALTPVLEGFMEKLGPEMDWKARLVFANQFLFKGIILDQYVNSASGNSLVRTTTSPTVFEAGIKDNVIPTSATALVNFRILPGETTESVIERVNKVIDDERVNVTMYKVGNNPSAISPIDNKEYAALETSIKEVFPDILTAPGLVIGATDSRHFKDVSDNIYKFAPFQVNQGNKTCFHGIDERVPVSEFEDAIRFYRRLIVNLTGN